MQKRIIWWLKPYRKHSIQEWSVLSTVKESILWIDKAKCFLLAWYDDMKTKHILSSIIPFWSTSSFPIRKHKRADQNPLLSFCFWDFPFLFSFYLNKYMSSLTDMKPVQYNVFRNSKLTFSISSSVFMAKFKKNILIKLWVHLMDN